MNTQTAKAENVRRPQFPIYAHHFEARCFNCGNTIIKPRPFDAPPGRGRWCGECPECGMRTWYDIEREA